MNRTASTKKEFSNRSKRPSTYRRVVTANVDGKSILRSDEQLQAYEFKSVPSYEHTLVWVNPTTPDVRKEQRIDRYPDSIVRPIAASGRDFCSSDLGLWPRQSRLPQVIGKVRGSSEQHRESIPMRFPLEILFRHRSMPLRPIRGRELRETLPQLLVDFLPCGFERLS